MTWSSLSRLCAALAALSPRGVFHLSVPSLSRALVVQLNLAQGPECSVELCTKIKDQRIPAFQRVSTKRGCCRWGPVADACFLWTRDSSALVGSGRSLLSSAASSSSFSFAFLPALLLLPPLLLRFFHFLSPFSSSPSSSSFFFPHYV